MAASESERERSRKSKNMSDWARVIVAIVVQTITLAGLSITFAVKLEHRLTMLESAQETMGKSQATIADTLKEVHEELRKR
jgi:hypothetical protein